MDEFNVIIETTAGYDLRGILRYITETLKEPATAQRVYFSIKEKISNLNILPHRHPLVQDEALASRGIRWMPAENYLVFYVVNEDNQYVSILRILHSRREWQNIL